MTGSPPLISCVMPTADRRAFVPRAIEQFLAQTHEPRELIILDDGADPVADLVPDDPRIRYERLPARMVLGSKRNLGCELARGELIAHWDDDDLYSPNRLAVQLTALQGAGSEALMCGVATLLFHDPQQGTTWRYTYPSSDRRPWVAGASMLYRRALWERRRFQAVSSGEDTRFVWAAQRSEVIMLRREDLIVARLHEQNTARKRLRSSRWTRLSRDDAAANPLIGGDPVPRRDATSPASASVIADREVPAAGTGAAARVTELPAATACLLSWKRPQHLPRIVQHLRRHPFIRAFRIWNNDPEVDLHVPGEDVTIIRADRNHGCHARYLCAAGATTDLIYTQDDDALNHDVEAVVRGHLAEPDRLAHALAPKHYAARQDLIFGDAQLGWVGWGAVFPRDWLTVLDALPEEVVGSWRFEQWADIYFTIMLGRQHRSIKGQIEHLRGHSTRGEAMYRDPAPQAVRVDAIRDALAHGRRLHRPHLPPLWNVVVTSHAYGRYLAEAVDSVLANPADVVVTIVDDGATDDTAAVAHRFAREHPGVRVIRHERRCGPAAAANSGIAASDSAFVIRLDADDRLGSGYLRAAEAVLTGGADVANPDALLFGDERGRWTTPATVHLHDLLERNRVHCAAAFRRSWWAEVGGFAADLPKWIDYDLWLRIAARGARIARVPGDHFYYRRHTASLSRSGPSREEMRRRMRDRHEHLYAGASAAPG